MPLTRVTMACAILGFASLHGLAGTKDFPALTARLIDTYAVPRFDHFDKSVQKLADDLAAGCAGKPKRLAAARKDFQASVLAWAAVEFLRFGPMSVTGRPERIAFWPDPRGVTQRQVTGLIARRDASALIPAELAKKSAAVQGLTALEYLMWDAKHPLGGKDEESRYRCSLAVSVAHNLAALSRDTLSAWNGDQGWRRRMTDPGPENETYKSAAEPPADFARALITGLQLIQDRQIVPLITANASAQAKTVRLPYAAAGLTAQYAAASVASLKALYDTMGLAKGVPKEKAWMPRWIGTAFGRLANDAPAAVKSGAPASDTQERARELRMVRFHVEGIRKLVGRELAPLAGLMIGFNELDGD